VRRTQVAAGVCHNGTVTHDAARLLRALALATVLGVTASACGATPVSAPTTKPTTTVASSTTSTTSATTTTTATTVLVPTTTAAVVPPAPQPTAETAANALVANWASGNRAVALRVATPDAVATLFAVPYPRGLAFDRGCTSAFPPIVCTYGPPAGGPTNAAIYQLYATQAPAGWYIGRVQIES
jgi:hypothetical protein